jgi:hypothetical protein
VFNRAKKIAINLIVKKNLIVKFCLNILKIIKYKVFLNYLAKPKLISKKLKSFKLMKNNRS